jgi:protein-disulfide isomerase-like protein with CxxC motif
MLDLLFSAFFERGRDLRDIDELVALAAEMGLDASEAGTVVKTGRYADAVRADRHLAAAHGVTTIPTYIVPEQPRSTAPSGPPSSSRRCSRQQRNRRFDGRERGLLPSWGHMDLPD